MTLWSCVARMSGNKRCVNPKNQCLVNSLKEKFDTTDSGKKWAYLKAMKSIQKCPIFLNNENRLMEVDGIGKNIVKILMDVLQKNDNYMGYDPNIFNFEDTQPKKKQQRKSKKYIPTPGSAAWAILKYMMIQFKDDGLVECSKQQIIDGAQRWTVTSMTLCTDENRRYNGFSSMGKLRTHDPAKDLPYVKKTQRGTAHFYSLTENGREMGQLILDHDSGKLKINENNKNKNNNNTNISRSNSNNNRNNNNDEKKKQDKGYKHYCPFCNKGYRVAGHMKNHIKTKHPDESLDDQNNSNNIEPPILIIDELPVDPYEIAIHCDRNNSQNSNDKSKNSGGNKRNRDNSNKTVNTKPLKKRKICYDWSSVVNKGNGNQSFWNMNTLLMDKYDYDLGNEIDYNGVTYELVMLVDSSELNKSTSKQFDILGHIENRIKTESCRLSVGDYIWVLRDKFTKNMETALVVNCIIERKRYDDLQKSMISTRYREQKYRINNLKEITRKIYLVEGSLNTLIEERYKRHIKQCLIGTESNDYFIILHAKTQMNCINILSNLTKILFNKIKQNIRKEIFDHKMLLSDIQKIKKNKPLQNSLILGRQLMTIKQVTSEIAGCITDKYPTMKCLATALKESQNGPELLTKIKIPIVSKDQLDDDLKILIKNMDPNKTHKYITKNLSVKIYQHFCGKIKK